MIDGDLNRHVREDASGYDGTHFFGKAGKKMEVKKSTQKPEQLPNEHFMTQGEQQKKRDLEMC